MRTQSRSGSSQSLLYAVTFVYVVPLFVALALFAATADAAERFADDPSVTVQMKDGQGKSVGTVKVVQLAQGTLFVTHLKNLPPGAHGFHIHSKAKCDPPKFKSAGGHYSPAGNDHGFDNRQGFHAGDLPNIHVTRQGTAETEIFVRRLVLGLSNKANENEVAEAGGTEGPFPLLDADGSAIMIHKHLDDYEAVPPGSTGPRIACGVIQHKRPGTIEN